MTNSVLMFVPFSVRMRAGGYELDRKQWVPAAVKKVREEMRAKFAAAVTKRKEMLRILGSLPRADVNWYTLMRAEDDAKEGRFVAMSESEWRRWQAHDIETWQTRGQRISGRAFWDRINGLRRAAPTREMVAAPSSAVSVLLKERRDILEFPQSNGIASVAEQEAALAEIEGKINASSGRWRLGAAKIAETRAEMMRVAEGNPESVLAIQRGWRRAIQRRAAHALGARFGIY
jgi:hypothetical protein